MTAHELLAALPPDYRAQVQRQLDALPEGNARGNKFHAEQCFDLLWPVLQGVKFDSKAERAFAQILAARLKAGEIVDLRIHPVYVLGPARIKYTADFTWREAGHLVACDVKGHISERWRIIRQLWRVHGPYDLRVVRRVRGRGMTVTETIQGGNR